MFCTKCGKEVSGSPKRCIHCGARPMSGNRFCHGCGRSTSSAEKICVACGAEGPSVWMPLAAGIIGLAVGGYALYVGAVLVFGVGQLGPLVLLTAPLGALIIILSIVAIVGGVFAIRRKVLGVALAGAICVLFVGFFVHWVAILLGLAAIGFTLGETRQFS